MFVSRAVSRVVFRGVLRIVSRAGFRPGFGAIYRATCQLAPLDFLFPPRCLLCDSVHDLLPGVPFCEPCSGDLLHNMSACCLCAAPLEQVSPAQVSPAQADEVCAQCLGKAPAYDYIWSPFVYAQPLEWMILQLKFSARLSFVPLLSGLMAQQLPMGHYELSLPQAIIPMPLHPRRLKQRGFNQSLELVRPLAKLLGLLVDTSSCSRIRDTEHQTGKTARQRRVNIKGAFSFENKRNYQHVVIFDDVVTTGSSVSELSRVLKRAGVRRVDVWCLARA